MSHLYFHIDIYFVLIMEFCNKEIYWYIPKSIFSLNDEIVEANKLKFRELCSMSYYNDFRLTSPTPDIRLIQFIIEEVIILM